MTGRHGSTSNDGRCARRPLREEIDAVGPGVERLDLDDHLTEDPQWRPARGQHPEGGDRLEQHLQGCAETRQLLEVVEDEDVVPARQHRGVGVQVVDAEHRRDRRRRLTQVGQVLEWQPRQRSTGVLQLGRDGERQPGLSHATWPGQDDEPLTAVQVGEHSGNPVCPADDRREGHRDRARLGRHRGRGDQGRVLVQDPVREPAQVGAGVDARLVEQVLARRPVCLHRLALTTGAVEGEHEVLPRPLPVGVLAHEPLELGHERRRPTTSQVSLDAVVEGGHPLLEQLGHPVGCEGLVRQIGERRTTPLFEALGEKGRRRLGPALGEQLATGSDRPPEALHVDLVGRRHELVGLPVTDDAARGARGTVGFEHPPQGRDVDLHVLAVARRHLLAPHTLGQPVEGHRHVGPQRQLGQHPSLLGATDVEGPPVVAEHLRRSEKSDQHHGPHVTTQPRAGPAARCSED